jgi:hypothetical protein
MRKSKVNRKKVWIVFILLIFGFSQVFAAACGDVNSNGDIDILDALIIAQYYVGLPVAIDETKADTNCDGSINIIDALLIAQYYVGLISDFC